MKPLMSLKFETTVDTMLSSMPHGLLLSGHDGSGLYTLANWLSNKSGTIAEVISPTKPSGSSVLSISVERVRDLYISTRARHQAKTFFIIDNADMMSVQAQNALLKLLEEPNSSTFFILTSHKPMTLLPTILSRVQHLVVPPIDSMESRRLIKRSGVTDERKMSQLLYVADGLPAMLVRLINDDALFSRLLKDVGVARTYIESGTYDKLVIIQQFKDDRASALSFIDTLTMLLNRISLAKPSQSIYRQIDHLADTYSKIEANGNVRLQLARSVLY